MTQITSVCFDLGGVANISDRAAAVRRGRVRWGDSFTSELLRKIIHAETPDHDYWREFNNGELSTERFLTISLGLVGLPTTLDDLYHARLCLEDWSGQPYGPVIDLALTLQEEGYKTAVLSNNNSIMYATPGAYLAQIVDVAISSHEIGFSKPKPEAYHALLEKLGGLEPDSVLFIDDKSRNIHGAQEAGLQTFHFRSREISMDEAFQELVSYLSESKIS